MGIIVGSTVVGFLIVVCCPAVITITIIVCVAYRVSKSNQRQRVTTTTVGAASTGVTTAVPTSTNQQQPGFQMQCLGQSTKVANLICTLQSRLGNSLKSTVAI